MESRHDDQLKKPLYRQMNEDSKGSRSHIPNILGSTKLFLSSLIYNHDATWLYGLFTALQPMFYFIDNHMRYFSPFFTVIVFILLMIFIVIAYAIGLL